MTLHWEPAIDDEWTCGSACASLENGALFIFDFGPDCDQERALELIRAATRQFDGPPWVVFSAKTDVADELLDSGTATSLKSIGSHLIRLVITP